MSEWFRVRPAPGWLLAAVFAAGLGTLSPGAAAHEVRPAYLEIRETSPERYEVLWRTPVRSGTRLPVMLRFPADLRTPGRPTERELPDSVVERFVIESDTGLAGRRIDFPGLEATLTDVLVRVEGRDGTHTTALVRPSRPWLAIPAANGGSSVAGAYLGHGIEHILFGYDHLLFVLALLLLVRSRRVLLATITAFTLAHTLTLALATLQWVRLSPPPIEATIALSILLLACEILRMQHGEESLTRRWPWVVAFAFGLLHGFGFAGALLDLGLPSGEVPLALLAFNVGVELGQLAFVAAMLAAIHGSGRLRVPAAVRTHARPAAAYAIGAMAAFWFFERVAGFVG